jgi:hypothetical protein
MRYVVLKLSNSSIINTSTNFQEDGEWEEVDDEKDYSGLKIQSLNIKDKEEELREQKLQEASEQQESKMTWKTHQSNVSGKSEGNEESSMNKKEEVQSKPEVQAVSSAQADSSSSNVSGGKYIPPSMRTLGSQSTSSDSCTVSAIKMSSLRGVRNVGKAPSIQNQMEFPTLGEEPVVSNNTESARSHWREPAKTSAPVRNENRFDALKKHLQQE